MWTYLLLFALTLWPPTDQTGVHSARQQAHRLREMSAITADIVSTDATILEALTLENIVAYESGFERSARGRAGEMGAYQIMPSKDTTKAQLKEWQAHGAKEALRRLRVQGIDGYCGCSKWSPCPKMVENRTRPAREWLAEHPLAPIEVAGNP